MTRRRAGASRRTGVALATGVLLIAIPVASPVPAGDDGPPRFVDVAAEVGVSFVHRSGASDRKHLPETMGSGVAWIDFDGDGDLDLYAVQSGTFPPDGGDDAANRLFRNDGGRFTDVARAAGADDRGYGQGALAADLDGDGHLDLYVTNVGPDAFYRNRGDGSFENATADAGLGLDGWSSSAAAADADGDGDLDLYVVRYVEFDPDGAPYCADPSGTGRRYCDPTLFAGATDVLYANRGDGTFERRPPMPEADGKGLGVLWSDLDDDGDPDVYVANDLTANALYRNLGDGTFEPVSWLSGAAVNREGKAEAGMGLALGDVDGDLDPDVIVSNFDVETNTLYRNDGDLFFEDVSATSGFGPPSFNYLGFGAALVDVDGDGALDAYVTNGHIFDRPRRETSPREQPDLLLRGDGRGGFRDPMDGAGLVFGVPLTGRGLAVADWDDDGDPDLAISNNAGPLQLLRNERPAGSWIGIRLVGPAPNVEAIGARVRLRVGEGVRAAWVLAGDSYLSSSERRVRFAGIDPDAGRATLEVRWPDGVETTHPVDPAAGAYRTLRREGAEARFDAAPDPRERGGGGVLRTVAWIAAALALLALWRRMGRRRP